MCNNRKLSAYDIGKSVIFKAYTKTFLHTGQFSLLLDLPWESHPAFC